MVSVTTPSLVRLYVFVLLETLFGISEVTAMESSALVHEEIEEFVGEIVLLRL